MQPFDLRTYSGICFLQEGGSLLTSILYSVLYSFSKISKHGSKLKLPWAILCILPYYQIFFFPHEILVTDLGQYPQYAMLPACPLSLRLVSGESQQQEGWWAVGLACSDLSVSVRKMGAVMSQAHEHLIPFCRVAGSSKEHKHLFKGQGEPWPIC